jgi:hypothetical protein
MRNVITVNKHLIILRTYLVLEPLSFNKYVMFPENFRKVFEKNNIKQQVLKLDETGLFWRKIPCTLVSKNEKIYQGFKSQRLYFPLLLL